jgi:hypothetical protein
MVRYFYFYTTMRYIYYYYLHYKGVSLQNRAKEDCVNHDHTVFEQREMFLVNKSLILYASKTETLRLHFEVL